MNSFTLKRYLIITVCIVTVLLLLGSGGWYAVEHRIAQRCGNWLDAVESELDNGSALKALDASARALGEPACNAAGDAELWTAYARARVRVREPELAHLTEAVKALRQARAIDSSNPETATLLAEAMLGAGLNEAALETAQSVLKQHDYLPAQRITAAALLAAGRNYELRRLLDEQRWTDKGFWFKATRLLIADQAEVRSKSGQENQRGRERNILLERLLQSETAPHARLVLAALGGELNLGDNPEAFIGELSASEVVPGLDVLGTALLLLQQLERPDLMLQLLASHVEVLDNPLRNRMAALAWQAGQVELIAEAVEAGSVHLFEFPELLAYGALAGHAESILVFREFSNEDTWVARSWRELVISVLDKAGPAAIADASARVLLDSPGSALVLTLGAEAWFQLGEIERAEELALQAMDREPFWSQPRLIRGAVVNQMALQESTQNNETPTTQTCTPEWSQADGYLACAVNQLPASTSAWQSVLLASANARRVGDLDAADVLISRLRDITPEQSILWRLARARALLAPGRSEEDAASAAQSIREVLDMMPDHAEARLLLALARGRLNDIEGAQSDLLAALEIDPDLWQETLRAAVALISVETEAYETELVELVGQIFARAPISSELRLEGELTWLRGIVSTLAGKNHSQLERAAYARLVDLAPNQHFALNNYAWLLYQAKEDKTTALNLAERAVALVPENGVYADTLASIQEWDGETLSLPEGAE